MQKTLTSRSFLIVLGGALLICAASKLSAQSYLGSESYPGSAYNGQWTSGVTGSTTLLNNDCAPVATANGLSYLYSLHPSAFGANPGTSTAINSLVTDMHTSDAAGNAGTSGPNAISGVQSYLAASGDSIASSQTGPTALNPNNYPTAQLLANALNAGSAVQLGLLWGWTDVSGDYIPGGNSGNFFGGHFVSLTAINYNASTESGTVTIVDPWGTTAVNPTTPFNADATATSVVCDLYGDTLNNPSGPTVLEVEWPNALPGGPDDRSTDNQTGADLFGSTHYQDGYIYLADIETVPEPTTMSLLLMPLGAGLLRMLRKNRGA
jgi:hypothetical protein